MQKRLSGVNEIIFEEEYEHKEVLDQKCLDEDIPSRCLVPENPNSSKLVVSYDPIKRTLKTQDVLDHLVIHFEYDGQTILRDSEDAKLQEEIIEKRTKDIEEVTKQHDLMENMKNAHNTKSTLKIARKILRNKFNYSERQTQTHGLFLKSRGVSTVKPHLLNFHGEVNQSIIFDAYVQSIQSLKQNPKKGTSDNILKQQKAGNDQEKDEGGSTGNGNESKIYSSDFEKKLKLMERMIVQNAEKDKYHDLKYIFTGTASDTGLNKQELIYPLWRFSYPLNKSSHITCIKWNPKYR
jgi:dynein intermediate chain 1